MELKNETNLEKAKRLVKASAEIQGVVLTDDNYFFEILQLAATPDYNIDINEFIMLLKSYFFFTTPHSDYNEMFKKRMKIIEILNKIQ